MQHYHNTSLLNLKEFKETVLFEHDDLIAVRIEKASRTAACPHCSHVSSRVHDRRKQTVRDLPIRNKQVNLLLVKRRFRCTNSECNRVCNEQYQSVDRYQRMTNRLMQALGQESVTSTFKGTSRRYNLSPTSARRYFLREAKKLDNYSYTPPRVMAMDEFAGTTSEGKYHLAIGDPFNKKLLDILPSRDRLSVQSYLQSLPGKEHIKVFCIDMWKHFKNAIKTALPDVQIVIDKFHVMRNVNWALDKVRKRVAKSLPAEVRRHFKGYWRLPLSNHENLKPEAERKLSLLLRHSKELRLAYSLKEWFRCWYQANTYEIARSQLNEWYEAVEISGIKEFRLLAKTIRNWQQQILNYFFYRVTNGFLEGRNNKIKVIKRNAYGFRDFNTFRAKVLLDQI